MIIFSHYDLSLRAVTPGNRREPGHQLGGVVNEARVSSPIFPHVAMWGLILWLAIRPTFLLTDRGHRWDEGFFNAPKKWQRTGTVIWISMLGEEDT